MSGLPAELLGMPNRRTTTVLRPWELAVPPRPVELELVTTSPQGWHELPRGQRKPPLLFVHGACSGAWAFTRHWLGAAVRRGCPASALSLRGHGGSAGRDRLHLTLLRDYVDDVLRTATAMPEPPVIIGHGMGAVVTQLVLERYPARAGVLVAPSPMHGIGGTVWEHTRSRPRTALSALLSGRLPQEPDLMFVGLDGQTAAAHLARMQREAPLVLLQLGRRIRIGPVYCPVAVAGAREDAVIRPADVRGTAEIYAGRPIWLPGAGHLVMLDGSHGVALDIILDWVDDNCGAVAAVDLRDPVR